jgi:autotransporter-associated beta strand protein
VGGYFYGATGFGVAPGVSHVDNYSVDDFFGTTVFFGEPIPDAVVNQSLLFGQSGKAANVISNQQSSDTTYDNYVAQYGTIFVSGVGNGNYLYPAAPSTSYNGIAVGVDDGPSASGPTEDNGRSKPDITAPGAYTSFSTAQVSGCAALLVQAGASGDGGSSPQIEADAVDPRTVKALLLNGADKQVVTFNRTHTAPLDPVNGAGQVNVYNSYLQLAAGIHPASSISNTSSVGAPHPADTTSAPAAGFTGWNFSTLTSSPLSDAYANYVFTIPAGAPSTLTATLVWERQYNLNPSVPLGINNLDLYLYDTTANKLIDYSTSIVDNVQDVYDQNLTPGDRYDLEVLKTGGIPGVTPDVVSSSETYALAFNLAAAKTAQGTWNSSGGGNASVASNWAGTVPQFATDTASFASAITSAATVTLASNWTVGNINFDNTHSYTIAPASSGPLTLDNGGINATSTISDAGGTQCIAEALQLNSQLAVSVTNAGDSLKISGNISDNPTLGGGGLTLGGLGTLVLSGVNTYASGTTVNSGTLLVAAPAALPAGGKVTNNASLQIQAGSPGTPVSTGQISGSGALTVGTSSTPAYLQLTASSGTSSQSSLTINSGSTLDLTNNTLQLNYGVASNDPAQAIRGYLKAGYNGGLWTGKGLTSSIVQAQAAAANVHGGGVYSIGYVDGAKDPGQSVATGNQLVIRPALAGDVYLSGSVTFLDLAVVAQNLGDTNADWAHGDFNYDGTVNFLDLGILAQNLSATALNTPLAADLPLSFQSQWALAVAEVHANDQPIPLPEPAAATLLAAAAGLLCRRRRRSSCCKK